MQICGGPGPYEIDHIDPSTKVTHCVFSWSKNRRDVELLKCQVLCKPCHYKKTAVQNSRPMVHGSNSTYTGSGCRCESCKIAHSISRKNDYLKAKAKRPARDSLGSYYPKPAP